MALTDLMLKAKVNLALARDPRVGFLDIGVQAADGVVTLEGDLDNKDECRVAVEIARQVDGVRTVDSQLTCGLGREQDTADLVSQRFLEKLEEEWEHLPENSALAQADYLKWALWMIYKFRIPDTTGAPEIAEAQARTTNEAIQAVASHLNCPAVLVALELQRVADQAGQAHYAGPSLLHSDLATSPLTDDGNTELAA